MYRPRRAATLVASLALALSATVAGAATSAARPANPAPSAGGEAETAQPVDASLLGNADDDRAVSVSVALKPRHQAALDAMVKAVGDPDSPLYRHYLTAKEYNARFAPSKEDVRRVTDFLAAHDLSVVRVSGNRQVVTAEGTVSSSEEAFGTQVANYRSESGERFYAPKREPQVPSKLSDVVRTVVGLSDREAVHRAAAPAGPTGPGGGYTPAQLRHAYGMEDLSASYDGSGETVGLIEFDTFKQSDIDTWTNRFDQPRVVPQVVKVDGGVSRPGGGQLEVTLDIDAVAAMAPRAEQIVYSAPNTNQAWVDEMARIASDDDITILSGSWLLGEKCGSDPIAASHDSYQQMALQGVTLVSASGDWGATGCGYSGDNSTLQVDYPASDPLFTGVGGTTLTTSDSAGTYDAETCWNTGSTGSTRSGGGYSQIFDRPDYQRGTNAHRSVPDVALLADYNAGALSVNTNGNWQSVGGTSLSSPLWAGYVALLNQKATGNGDARLGQLNPAVYDLGRSADYGSLFHDTTRGDNGTYEAGTGYDLCTGWGSMKGDALGEALLGGTQAPPEDFGLSLSPASGTVQPGGEATTTVHTTAGENPTGDITLSAGDLPDGVSVTFDPQTVSPGADAAVTITTAGSVQPDSYRITVTGTAGEATHSAGYTLTVAGDDQGGDLALTNPGNQISHQGNAVDLPMQAEGGSTPYRWSAAGLPAGLSIDASTGVISGTPAASGTMTYRPTVTVTDSSDPSASVTIYWFVFAF
jgi:hypothetical protein